MSFESAEQYHPHEPQHRAPESSAFALGANALEVIIESGGFHINPVYGSPGGGPGDLSNSPGYIPITVANERVTAQDLADLTSAPSDAQRAFFLTPGEHHPPRPEEPPLQNLPGYTVVGRQHPGFDLGLYVKERETARDIAYFGNQSSTTELDLANISQARTGLLEACAAVGVDVRGRLPLDHHYHFFGNRNDYDDALRTAGGDPAPNEAGCYVEGIGILWKRQDDPVMDTYGAFHEGAHWLARHRLWLRPESSPQEPYKNQDAAYKPLLIIGYQAISLRTPHAHSAIDEVATDMLACDGMRRTGGKPGENGYSPVAALWDAAIWETAETQEAPAKLVADGFMRGMLTGDMSALRMIGRALGTDRFRQLMALRGNETYDEALEAADRLKLPDATDSIQDMQAGGGFHLFDWQSNATV